MSSAISPDRLDLAVSREQGGQPNDRRAINWNRYVAASIAIGVIFILLDAVVNTNPLAEQAYAVFAPILRPGIDIVPAMAIDLAYGFALSAIFVVLYRALPGGNRLLKGLSFGLLLWFLRVVMSAAGQWVLFAIPETTVTYTLASGLLEMLVLGVLLGMLATGAYEEPPPPQTPERH
jgi:hypothetical protein